MGFNAGGTNVAGVQAIEQGKLSVPAMVPSTFSVGGGETLNMDYTVPAGKIWILKSVSISPGSFSGTLGSFVIYVYDGTNQSPIYTGTSATSQTSAPVQPITIPAGYSVRLRLITSAWTSGQLATYALYQEIDA